MIDALNYCVRVLVMKAMLMAINTVRPADQRATTGGPADNFATVKIMTDMAVGDVDRALEDDGHGGTNEAIQSIHKFTASVQFFKATALDRQGLPVYSNFAFDQASRLTQRMQLTPMIELMQALGIGFLDASPARNLSAKVDDTWENRGSIDLTFNVINKELVALATVTTASLGLQVQEPDGFISTRNIEVTT